MLSLIKKSVMLVILSMLVACASVQTAIEHRNLETHTKMSKVVFIDPVPQRLKTVYVDVKNTSDQTLDIQSKIKQAIQSHGYKIVSNPNHAHYMLQANVLQVGKMSKTASQNALGGGYGSALGGVATGAAIASLSDNTNTTVAGGVIGGLVSMAADSMVKAVNYVMITDLQISERSNEVVHEKTQSNLSNGTSTQTIQSSKRGSHWRRYRTRILSQADKVNLQFAEARPALERGLVKSISGIF
jgi:outer membrane lipoprotein SlyB